MVIEPVDEPLGPILIRRPGGELSNTCDVQQLAVLWVEHDLFWEDADAMEEIASGSGQSSELFLSHDTLLLELSGLGGHAQHTNGFRTSNANRPRPRNFILATNQIVA